MISGRHYLVFGVIIFASIGGYLYISAGQPHSAGSRKPLTEVVVPKIVGLAKAGETLFNANCAACHGQNAAGNDGAGPPLVHIIYEPNHHSDQAFYMAAQNGVRQHHWTFGNMQPVKTVSREDIGNIIVYVRTLQSANGIN